MIIEPQLVEKVWEHVWPLIEETVVLESEQDVLNDLKTGQRFLLVVGDGACVARSCGDFFEINYVGGKKAKNWWPQMSQMIDALAKATKATKIVAFGRDGWKKIAPDFTPTNTRMYIKEVA